MNQMHFSKNLIICNKKLINVKLKIVNYNNFNIKSIKLQLVKPFWSKKNS